MHDSQGGPGETRIPRVSHDRAVGNAQYVALSGQPPHNGSFVGTPGIGNLASVEVVMYQRSWCGRS